MNRSHFLRLALVAPWAWQRVCASEGGRDAVQEAIRFLIECQSKDGAWRADQYGAFRSGHALTPMVLRALSLSTNDSRVMDACAKGAAWLVTQKDTWLETYPVHLASALLETIPRLPALSLLQEQAVSQLRKLQLNHDKGWKADHPAFGGWAYAPEPAEPSREIAPMQQPNLSATVMALDGLMAVGESAVSDDALVFVRRCQNFEGGDERFDDGGFFQIAGDPSRNKAGQAGTDRSGRIRLRSYASATADGLRALSYGSHASDKERMDAATHWLNGFHWDAKGDVHNPADLIYYAARSMVVASRRVPGLRAAAAGLQAMLAREQGGDGSWRNAAVEMREDCPQVATALALEACLAKC